jgi:hypothetical protein
MTNPLDRVLSDTPASVSAPPVAPRVRSQEILGGPGSVLRRVGQQGGVRAPGAGVFVEQTLTAGVAQDARQVVVVNAAVEPRYFEIVVLPAGEGPGGDLPVAALQPGGSYRVRISARDNPATPATPEDYTQHAVRVRESVWLFLAAQPAAGGEDAEVDAAVVEYPADALAGWSDELSLRLPDRYADPFLLLELRYQEPGAGEPGAAAARRLAVRPGAAPLAGAAAISHALDARFAPPPWTAVLYLSSAGPGQVLASGFLPERANRPHRVAVDLPPLPTGPFAHTLDFVRDLADSMDDFSTGATGGIGPWLEEMLRLYGDRCSLMITDDTGGATPWELFLLEDGSRLGARARVVRWVNVVHRDRPLAWETEPVRVPGRLAAYVHPDDVDSPLARAPALAASVKTYSDPDDLRDALLNAADEGAPVGLIYLALRGSLAYDPDEEVALGALDPAPARMVRFRLRGMEGKLTPRPLVFANAPYSGRVPRVGTRPCGLTRALLTQVACGYIGALGPVDPEHAADFAERLLSAISAADGEVRPVELLQEMRSRALEVHGNRRLAPEQRLAALMAFLYVYYGNPRVSIRAEDGDNG